ncbi:hypothetical protein THAOC_14643, partial [Thalassiosira oceanica]
MDVRRNELHVALRLRSIDLRVVRSILEQNLCSLSEQDEHGDQPAHIAARHGHVDSMKLLIEYDAPMGRKNHANLTPLGEAQMNGHKEIAKLIKDNYSTTASQEYIWDGEIDRETACWFNCYDEEEQRLKWVRLGADGKTEISDTPPPPHCGKGVGDRTQGREEDTPQVASVHEARGIREKEGEAEATVGRHTQGPREARRGAMCDQTAVKISNRPSQEACRAAIQGDGRINKDTVHLSALDYAQEAGFVYQDPKRRSHVHGKVLLRLVPSRALVVETQLLLVQTLPDPLDMRNHDYWVGMQRNARPPRREIGIFAEYTIGGFPRSWEERSLKLGGDYFRDAVFYANTITMRATWTQPSGFQF